MRQTKMDADPYQEIVEYYDLEHDAYRADLALIEHLIDTVGDPVLELACGTGRVLSAVARDGRRLTGVDNSASMLDAARRRLGDVHGQVHLVDADMADLPLPDGEFGIVIIALNGLLHATTPLSQRGVLTETHRCLDPRGMLYLDVANPPVAWPSSGHQPVILEGNWTARDGSEVQKFQSVKVDPALQIAATTIWYDACQPDGSVQRRTTRFDLRFIHAAELELMLELAGFVEWRIYGSYDLDPYAAESPRLIALAEKTPSR